MRITTNSKQQKVFSMDQIVIFCDTDDFCKAYEEYCRNKLLMNKEEVVPRTRMSLQQFHFRLIVTTSRKPMVNIFIRNNRKGFFNFKKIHKIPCNLHKNMI